LRLIGGQGELVYRDGGAPQPTPTPTSTPVACDSGIDPASLSLDTFDLEDSYIANCIFGTPYDASQPPSPVGLPDHIAVHFGVARPEDARPGDAIIYLIPVDEYQTLWNAAGDENVAESISTLQELLVDKPIPVPTSEILILPYEEVRGTSDLQVQGQYHEIQMGEGIRFVTRFSQGPNPVVRDDPSMVYTFQGFSLDGTYLITFFYPVTSQVLQPSEEISEEEFAEADSDPPAYIAEKAEELNELSDSDWEPDLGTLDAMIASLQYQTQPTDVLAAADRATPPAPGTTIFSDDFSVNRGWYTDEGERASFEYKGGAYQITNKAFLANIWSVRSLRREDVGQQVDLQAREGVGYYGVVCRHSDDGNDYYALTMGYDGFYGIGLNEGGDFRFLVEGTDDSEVIDRTPGAVNTLRGDCVGDELSLYINGRRMLMIEDDTIETGEIGFLNGTGAQPGQVVRYDDYTVFEP
jgi:hypothetical protein